jgi:hypothetical protein
MSRINNENMLAPEIRCDDKNIISTNNYDYNKWIEYIPLCVLYHYDWKSKYSTTFHNIYDIFDSDDLNKDYNDLDEKKIKDNNKKYIKKINDITSNDFDYMHTCIYIRGYLLLNIQVNDKLINNRTEFRCCRDHDNCDSNYNSPCHCESLYSKKALKLAIDVGIKYSRSIQKYKKIRNLLLNKICKDVYDHILLKYLYDDYVIDMIKNDNLTDITSYLKSYKKIKNKKLRKEAIMNDFSWVVQHSNRDDCVLKNLSCLTTNTIGFPIELDKKYDESIIVFNYNKDPYNTYFISIHLNLFTNIYPFTSKRIYGDLDENTFNELEDVLEDNF